jgi:hypothetical protein
MLQIWLLSSNRQGTIFIQRDIGDGRCSALQGQDIDT